MGAGPAPAGPAPAGPAPAGTAPDAAPDPGRRPVRRDLAFKLVALAGALVLVAFVVSVVVQGRPSRPSPTPGTFPPTTPSSLAPGTVAPTFSLARLGGGPPVALPAAGGKPTILNFFASWCSHCRAELRSIATVASGSRTRVTVVGVDTSDPGTTTAEHLLSAAGATYAVGVDPTARIAAQYRITGLPVTYFIGTSGKVDGVAFGAQTTTSLDRWVRRLTGSP